MHKTRTLTAALLLALMGLALLPAPALAQDPGCGNLQPLCDVIEEVGDGITPVTDELDPVVDEEDAHGSGAGPHGCPLRRVT